MSDLPYTQFEITKLRTIGLFLKMDKPTEVIAIRNQAEFVIVAAVVKKGAGAEGHFVAEAVFNERGDKVWVVIKVCYH